MKREETSRGRSGKGVLTFAVVTHSDSQLGENDVGGGAGMNKLHLTRWWALTFQDERRRMQRQDSHCCVGGGVKTTHGKRPVHLCACVFVFVSTGHKYVSGDRNYVQICQPAATPPLKIDMDSARWCLSRRKVCCVGLQRPDYAPLIIDANRKNT